MNRMIIGVLLLLVFNFLIIRGTFGMYPLGKMLPNVSTDKFINLLPQNGVRSFIDALKQRKKLQNHSYNLIKDINLELIELMKRDNIESIQELIGSAR